MREFNVYLSESNQTNLSQVLSLMDEKTRLITLYSWYIAWLLKEQGNSRNTNTHQPEAEKIQVPAAFLLEQLTYAHRWYIRWVTGYTEAMPWVPFESKFSQIISNGGITDAIHLAVSTLQRLYRRESRAAAGLTLLFGACTFIMAMVTIAHPSVALYALIPLVFCVGSMIGIFWNDMRAGDKNWLFKQTQPDLLDFVSGMKDDLNKEFPGPQQGIAPVVSDIVDTMVLTHYQNASQSTRRNSKKANVCHPFNGNVCLETLSSQLEASSKKSLPSPVTP